MLTKLQKYREAESLVLGLNKETSLINKVEMSRGMDSSPKADLPQPCCIFSGFQTLLEGTETLPLRYLGLPPPLVYLMNVGER